MTTTTEQQEEAGRWDKRFQQCIEIANDIDVKTNNNNVNNGVDNNEAVGGGAAAQQTKTTTSKPTCLCVITTCQPDTADMLPDIATFDGFLFHIICHVLSLIADMSAIQQPASVGEARRGRRQCNERGVGSGEATKNNEIMALVGGGGNWQR
jgi:hypothetical protein